MRIPPAATRRDRAPFARITRRIRRLHQRLHILVVNGYPDGREMYVDYLRFCGFSVVGASDPGQALRWIQLLVPDVIVTDFVFPTGQLDGPGFIARVRETASGRHPRVIVISGFTRRSDEQRAREAGADRFVLKPCLPHDLLQRIDRIMMSGGARER